LQEEGSNLITKKYFISRRLFEIPQPIHGYIDNKLPDGLYRFYSEIKVFPDLKIIMISGLGDAAKDVALIMAQIFF
jgi:hypothetical protein